MTMGFFIETRLANDVIAVNSSPVFNSEKFSFPCVLQPNTIDFSASDPDGDSLVIVLDTAYDYIMTCGPGIQGLPLSYAPGYSFSQPILSSPSGYLDPVSGLYSFTPTVQQVCLVSVRVREYRNGQLLGSIHRDLLVPVISGTLDLSPGALPGMNVTVRPNPARDALFVDAGERGQWLLEIADFTGRVLQRVTFESRVRIDITALPGGIYLYRLGTAGENIQVASGKFAVLRRD
jgi:hypothetical protein